MLEYDGFNFGGGEEYDIKKKCIEVSALLDCIIIWLTIYGNLKLCGDRVDPLLGI